MTNPLGGSNNVMAGVRPSQGAETWGRQMVSEWLVAPEDGMPAAPEDGRAPR